MDEVLLGRPSVLYDCLLTEHLNHGFINPKIVLILGKKKKKVDLDVAGMS